MNNEKRADRALTLLVSMSDIDDRLIEEARHPYPIFFTIKRTIALVASLLIVMVISISAIALAPAFAPAGDEFAGSGDAPQQSDGSNGKNMIGEGIKVTHGELNNITLIKNENSRYSFLINLGEGLDSADIYIYGYTITDDDKLTRVVSTTAEEIPDGYTRLSMPQLILSENGKDETAVTAIPTEAGSYMLSFDLSSFKANGFIIESIEITPFNAKFNPN